MKSKLFKLLALLNPETSHSPLSQQSKNTQPQVFMTKETNSPWIFEKSHNLSSWWRCRLFALRLLDSIVQNTQKVYLLNSFVNHNNLFLNLKSEGSDSILFFVCV